MPRRARIVIPQVPVHLIQRGHNRRACFLEEEDFEYYLHWLEYSAAKFGCEIHAYVLMHNHVHIAATPHERDALAHLMKSLNQRFVAHINKCHERVAGSTNEIATDLIRCATNANHVIGTASCELDLGEALTHRLPPGQRGRPKKGTT